MGGFGSGDYFRLGKKTTLSDCRSLDINRMVKEGAIPKCGYRAGSWAWTDASTGERKSSISYISDTCNPEDSYLRLQYTITNTGQKIDYKIRIEATQPNYGGRRFWFICPSTGNRVAKLYLHPGGDWFASRQAYRLAYACQSENPHDRAIRRFWKLKAKIDEVEDFYFRPKGMHNKTFEALADKIDSTEAQVDRLFMAKLGCFLKQYPGLLPNLD